MHILKIHKKVLIFQTTKVLPKIKHPLLPCTQQNCMNAACDACTELCMQLLLAVNLYTDITLIAGHFLTSFNIWLTNIHFGQPNLLYIFNVENV